jgi:hypothetical protein
MKRLAFLLPLFLIINLTGCAGIQYQDQPQSVSVLNLDRSMAKTRVLAVAEEWRNSGVVVEKGKNYEIKAQGRWSGGLVLGWTGPDGVGASTNVGSIVKGYSVSTLIGKINENGKPFAIGNELVLSPQETGTLYYRSNDGGMPGDNDGYVDVEVALKGTDKKVVARSSFATENEAQSFSVIKSDVDDLPAAIGKPKKNFYAIVIGIESYRQKLPKADFAVSDARLVSDYLTKVMGYPEENVILLTNEKALQSDLTKYFEKWLHNNVEKDGTVFIYYSGHGAPNPKTGDAYLVPYDGDPSFIDQTGYSLKRMYDALGKLPAKEIVVALDSCFSGAGGRSVIAKGARPLVITMSGTAIPKKVVVLSAASEDQMSSTYEEKGHGLFTYFMLKGIKNEDVVKRDGSIAISDLFSYIKPQVERIARKQFNNEQTPQLIDAKKN